MPTDADTPLSLSPVAVMMVAEALIVGQWRWPMVEQHQRRQTRTNTCGSGCCKHMPKSVSWFETCFFLSPSFFFFVLLLRFCTVLCFSIFLFFCVYTWMKGRGGGYCTVTPSANTYARSFRSTFIEAVLKAAVDRVMKHHEVSV